MLPSDIHKEIEKNLKALKNIFLLQIDDFFLSVCISNGRKKTLTKTTHKYNKVQLLPIFLS